MKVSQVAATLYTVRQHCKTPKDIATTLAKVRKIGYPAVQLSGMGPIEEAELVKMIEGEGLVCCATHEKTQQILDEPSAVVERLQKLNCRYTAVPSPGGVPIGTMQEVLDYVKRIDAAGKVLADADQVLTYHNHHIEFRRVEGQLLLDLIYGKTDPRNLQGEIDTHWVQAGGGDPVAWCAKLKGRLPLLHLKDFGIEGENNRVFKEIGQGNLNWKAIVEASDSSGCEWFIVEQDGNFAGGDPFESLKISFEYIRDTLCTK